MKMPTPLADSPVSFYFNIKIPTVETQPPQRPLAPRLVRWLRLGSAAVVTVALAFWGARGAHLGWSQSRVPQLRVDDVTGLSYTIYDERFIPGIDFLITALAGGAGLLILALFFRQTQNKKRPQL